MNHFHHESFGEVALVGGDRHANCLVGQCAIDEHDPTVSEMGNRIATCRHLLDLHNFVVRSRLVSHRG